MIALCAHHHKEADISTFTDQQLRNLKRQPFLRMIGQYPRGLFDWKRENFLFLVGGNFYYNTSILLRIRNKNIIWLSKDERGFEQLNLDIRDSDGKLLLKMRENDWLILAPFDDLECRPSGNSLLIKASHQTRLDLIFSQIDKSKMREKIQTLSEKSQRFMSRRTKAAFQDLQKKDSLFNDENLRKLLNHLDGSDTGSTRTERLDILQEIARRTKNKDLEESLILLRAQDDDLDLGLINTLIGGEIIPLCTIEGQLNFPNKISLYDHGTELGTTYLAGNYSVNSGSGLNI